MPFAPLELASREYHTVHVTLVAGVPDPTYFQRTAENVPSFIVSTGKPLSKSAEQVSQWLCVTHTWLRYSG